MKIEIYKKIFLLLLIFNMPIFVHALDLDETVDDEIRKNYNPNQLIQDVGIKESALEKNLKSTEPDEALPALPNITNSTKNSDVKNENTISVPYTPPVTAKRGNIKIRKWTSFDVVSTAAISDWQKKGTKVRFKTKQNKYGKTYVIPGSTVFLGEIVESHQPQITCNGGLVAIEIYGMIYKGQTIPVKGYITRADDKKIFLNNIKGDRTYLKTTWKKGNWGRTLFGRMFNLTVNLGGDGSTFILSPFPLAYGTICLGLNTLTSPICAFFSKGGHVSIPANSNFRIKLTDDAYID